MEEKLSLEDVLENIEIFKNNFLLKKIRGRYKAVEWVSPNKRKLIFHLANEILFFHDTAKVYEYKFDLAGDLTLTTTQGTMRFFNT